MNYYLMADFINSIVVKIIVIGITIIDFSFIKLY